MQDPAGRCKQVGFWGLGFRVEMMPFDRVYEEYMGGCQNYGPFWGPWYNTAPII